MGFVYPIIRWTSGQRRDSLQRQLLNHVRPFPLCSEFATPLVELVTQIGDLFRLGGNSIHERVNQPTVVNRRCPVGARLINRRRRLVASRLRSWEKHRPSGWRSHTVKRAPMETAPHRIGRQSQTKSCLSDG